MIYCPLPNFRFLLIRKLKNSCLKNSCFYRSDNAVTREAVRVERESRWRLWRPGTPLNCCHAVLNSLILYTVDIYYILYFSLQFNLWMTRETRHNTPNMFLQSFRLSYLALYVFRENSTFFPNS